MPTISITNEEYEAFMFYRDETMDKAENAEDEQYIADYNRHCIVFDKFREKYHNAKNKVDTQKRVKKGLKIALKIAENKGTS